MFFAYFAGGTLKNPFVDMCAPPRQHSMTVP